MRQLIAPLAALAAVPLIGTGADQRNGGEGGERGDELAHSFLYVGRRCEGRIGR